MTTRRTISVIIPTTGRDTLARAEASCADADEVIVVPNADGDRGYKARTEGMRRATGTHLAFLDDDDVYAPGALQVMRAAACDRPVIFRMDASSIGLGVLWADPVLRYANVGTPMCLVPNDPARLGVWEPHEGDRGGDYTFIRGCVERMGDPVWREEVVAVVRPRVSVAVVTPWLNHPELTDDYLEAIADERPDELIVVDNGSDPAVPFATVRLDSNHGVAVAYNIGLREATTDIVVFLNNDVGLVRHGWLHALAAATEPGVLVGANLRYDAHGDVDGQRLPYLDGWCLAGRREDLLSLDGFDESYEEPAYYSDNDLSLRARAKGMTLREVPLGLRHKLNMTANDDPAAKDKAAAANYERFAAAARELLLEGITP